MQRVEIGTNNYTEVNVSDEKGAGGAYHRYWVDRADDPMADGKFANVYFQVGPVQESGINGCHNEDLLAIVIHRLKCFQAGPFVCRENALALTKLEEAMHWLNHRTAERKKRGVEGTNQL